MSARYHAPKVETSGLTLRAGFDIENTSGETWSGLSIGYHIFDPETDTLVVDGARTRLDRDRAHLDMSFELPPEPGRYRVLVSPMRENVAWYYERGWRFLLIDAVVAEGRATVERVRIATRDTIARERMRRAAVRVFTLPVRTVWRNRGLIRTMVRRDVLGRYRGSFGGGLWAVLSPLLLMLTYFFVFGVVLRDRYDPNANWSSFALYFLAGMLPWLAFSEAAGRSPSVMLEHRNFVKKLVFAVETLPVNLVVAGLVTELFAILLYCGFLLAINHTLPLAILWLPVLIIPQILFTAGVSWFLAALGVFARDLGQIMGFILTLWFFLTPICYPESKLPHAAAGILTKNPIYTLVHGYRSIFLYNQAPEFHTMWKLWLLSAAICLLGHAWFYKLRKSFPDLL